jgi:hypothetical protein
MKVLDLGKEDANAREGGWDNDYATPQKKLQLCDYYTSLS